MEPQAIAPQVEVSSPSQPALEQTNLDASRWQRALRSPLLVLGMALGLAVGMWMVDFQPVSSDSTKLIVAYEPTVSDADLLNLDSPVWREDRPNSISKEVDATGKQTGKISTTIIPLSAQYILPQQGGSILQMRARAAFNDKMLAVLVQWEDQTKDFVNNVSQNKYSDSVALEFPLKYVPGHQPFRCMGQSDAQVNIWQWKAERDPGIAGQSRLYSTTGGKAAKNYLGPGAGYLKDGSGADPDSTARYDEATKTWSVIFRRPLGLADDKTATQFKPGEATNIAFALWDGGSGERLSKKSVSTWLDFIFQPGEASTQNLINMLAIGGTGVMMIIAVVLAWRFLPNPGTRRQ